MYESRSLTFRPASEQAKALKHARFALWKNPDNLTENQQTKLAWDRHLRPQTVSGLPPPRRTADDLHDALCRCSRSLDGWISSARRCRIPAFVKLQKSIVTHRARILAAIEHGLSNGLIESTNTKIRLITRIAFGFHSPPSPDRPGHAQPRRPPTHSPQPKMTHRSVRRTLFSGGVPATIVYDRTKIVGRAAGQHCP